MLENPNRNKLDKVYSGPFRIIDIQHPNVILFDQATNKQYIIHKNRIIKV